MCSGSVGFEREETMAYEPVRWGILSTARVNRHFIPAAQRSLKVELVGVASRRRDRGLAYAAEWRIPRSYESYEALLADRAIEAVYVSVPNSLHCEWAIRAAAAGKHVLCEKPLGRDPGAVAAAFDQAHEAGTLLMEAFMWRHTPQTRALKQLLEEGHIGTLRLIRACFSFQVDAANIRLRPDLDGGSLMDIGCYCVNAFRLIAGEPTLVFGQQWTGATNTDAAFTASLRFAGNVLGLFDCGIALVKRDELEAIGSHGALFLDDPWHCRTPVIELRKDGSVERRVLDPANPYQLEIENFSDAIRGEAVPLLGRDDAVGQARVIQALFESAASGRALPL
jgi:xylose dehydrogenase (NAD/NADP)